MQMYRMAFLDRLDFPVITRNFAGVDDNAALAHALSLCRTHKIAVTAGDRRVGEVAKGGFAPKAALLG